MIRTYLVSVLVIAGFDLGIDCLTAPDVPQCKIGVANAFGEVRQVGVLEDQGRDLHQKVRAQFASLCTAHQNR